MPTVFRRLWGALTDLGYLILSASPRLRPLYGLWARRRYRDLAPVYGGVAGEDPMYLDPLRTAIEHLQVTPRWIAEVGAGTGAATAVLVRRFPEATVAAVDATLDMLRQIAQPPERSVRRIVGDAFALPLRAGCVDLTVVHNAPFDLAELLGATAPDGIVLIVLSSARWIPSTVRASLVRIRHLGPGVMMVQQTSGAGVTWIVRREIGERRPCDGS